MFSCVGSMPSAPNAAYISAAQPPRSDAVRGTDFSISACTSTGLAGGVADGGPLAQLAINAAIPPVQRATAKHEGGRPISSSPGLGRRRVRAARHRGEGFKTQIDH